MYIYEEEEEGKENTCADRSAKMRTENWPLVLEILEVSGELDR